MDIGGSNVFYDVLESPPLKHDGWSSVGLASQAMSTLVWRMKLLREAGFTGLMVARDFIQRCIMPLQAPSVRS